MSATDWAWLVLAFPLAGSLVIALGFRVLSAKAAGWIGTGAIALAFVSSIGALLMLLSDLVARRLFAPTELPVGVVTGVVGAPYLLWLLVRTNRRGRA